jgi:pilus assembly protein Flp/PilA
MRNFILNLIRNRKGAALVEYSMLVAGVALISAAALAVLGHKTSDMVSITAATLPGAHADDNGPIVSGKLIETTQNADGEISADAAGIAANQGTSRLGTNLGVSATSLVVEAE